ncbi:MAG: alpha/beta hydrolase, partial [Bacteroidota bacterium]
YQWPDQTAPGFAGKKDIPEQAKDWWVKSVHRPSITVFHPEDPNGTAVLILPGGGHKDLVFDEEGTKAAKFLNTMGITAAVLKYRLFREEGSPYTIDHAWEDAVRAMQMMRHQSAKWHCNTLGIMGFSAGGELVNLVTFPKKKAPTPLNDAITAHSSSPDFHIQIYPGPLIIPKKVTKDAPPLFLLAANKDECCSDSILQLLIAYRKAGADVEAHLYSKGDHGFNMGDRSSFQTISKWPERLADWLADQGYLKNRK